jgi:hypothetical protein
MGPFERLRLILGAAAIGAWVVTLILDAVNPNYDPPQSVQLVVLIIAGSLFAPTIVRKQNGTS